MPAAATYRDTTIALVDRAAAALAEVSLRCQTGGFVCASRYDEARAILGEGRADASPRPAQCADFAQQFTVGWAEAQRLLADPPPRLTDGKLDLVAVATSASAARDRLITLRVALLTGAVCR
jgi:hypothetical protein